MLGDLINDILSSAKHADGVGKNSAETILITAVLITPVKQIVPIMVSGLEEIEDYFGNRSEDGTITIRMQPSVYFNDILPYRDDLIIQIIKSSPEDTVMREHVGIPLGLVDPRSEANSSFNANLEGISELGFDDYDFQLLNKAYAKLKNLPGSGIQLVSSIKGFIETHIKLYTQSLKLDDSEKFKDLVIVAPIDNEQIYKQVVVPESVRLVDIPSYLQNSELYGVYSSGLGFFYKHNYWWLYSLYDTSLYETHQRPIDILRVPRDKAPTLDTTYYINNNSITILATGDARHSDSADIDKINNGSGQRLIYSSTITGETGSYMNDGRAVRTRVGSMAEFKTSERKNEEEFLPIRQTPTSNVYKYTSMNRYQEGELLEFEWHNGDTGYLEPGHPLRYQYIQNENTIAFRQGRLLMAKTKYTPAATGNPLPMKRITYLTAFVDKQEAYKNKV